MGERRLGARGEPVPVRSLGDGLIHREEIAGFDGGLVLARLSGAGEIQEARRVGERRTRPERQPERPAGDRADRIDEAAAEGEVQKGTGERGDAGEVTIVLPLRPRRIEKAAGDVPGEEGAGLAHRAPGAPKGFVARGAGEALPGGAHGEGFGDRDGEETDAAAETARSAEDLTGRKGGCPVRNGSVEVSPGGRERPVEGASR